MNKEEQIRKSLYNRMKECETRMAEYTYQLKNMEPKNNIINNINNLKFLTNLKKYTKTLELEIKISKEKIKKIEEKIKTIKEDEITIKKCKYRFGV